MAGIIAGAVTLIVLCRAMTCSVLYPGIVSGMEQGKKRG